MTGEGLPKTGSLSGSNAAVRYGGAVRLASGPANLPDARLGVHACCVLQNEKTAEAFNAAAAADSSCAMAFWGQAMSLLHPLWTPPSSADARVAISAIERGLAAARTTRERDYLGAIRAYYADYDRTDPRARFVRYALAMDTVRRRSASWTRPRRLLPA